MQEVLGYSALKTGIAYLAVAGTWIVWAGVGSQLVTKVDVKPVLVVGMSLLTVGLLYVTQVSVNGSYLGDLLPGFLIVALGVSFSFVAVSAAAGDAVPAALTNGFQAAFWVGAAVAAADVVASLVLVRRRARDRARPRSRARRAALDHGLAAGPT
jgi:hypothetical protein